MSPSDRATPQAVRVFYDEVSPLYLEHAGPTFQAGLLRSGGHELQADSNVQLARRAGLPERGRILDAGCGVGGPAGDIARAFEGLRIDAVTISQVQVQIARSRLADLGDRVQIHESDYHQLPFEDDSFDGAYLFESSGYSAEPRALFAELVRVLKPGAPLYVKDFYRVDRPLSDAEAKQLEDVRRVWVQPDVPILREQADVAVAAGFVDVGFAELEDVGVKRFHGSMFAMDFSLNPFGERVFGALPSADAFHFGELRATAPG